jgi:hypothetical protein
MESKMNIFQRMAAVTAELQTVAKNLMVETGKGKGYKAVSERDIIDAVKPLETKFGIYSYPCSRRVLESQTLESESEYQGKVTRKTTFFTRIEPTYRFVNVEDPLDYIETVTFAEGIDTQDKGSGKAMTYGDKYALMKAYKISTGDDPDQNASTEERYTRRDTQPENIPLPWNDGAFVPSCANCGVEITVAEHDYSVKGWKKPLCRNCQKATPRK